MVEGQVWGYPNDFSVNTLLQVIYWGDPYLSLHEGNRVKVRFLHPVWSPHSQCVPVSVETGPGRGWFVAMDPE